MNSPPFNLSGLSWAVKNWFEQFTQTSRNDKIVDWDTIHFLSYTTMAVEGLTPQKERRKQRWCYSLTLKHRQLSLGKDCVTVWRRRLGANHAEVTRDDSSLARVLRQTQNITTLER